MVKVWYDQKTVEIYLDHEHIAVHLRRPGRGYNTVQEHMPANHQQALASKGWSREELLCKAERLGPNVALAAEQILGNSVYMEQNYKSCFGMLRLKDRYDAARLNAAWGLALTGSRINYTIIKNILGSGMDKLISDRPVKPLPAHTNIRGPQHYQ
jgi:hypothetical protein